jgi:hypothetical protein
MSQLLISFCALGRGCHMHEGRDRTKFPLLTAFNLPSLFLILFQEAILLSRCTDTQGSEEVQSCSVSV